MKKYKKVPEKIIFSSTISVYGENKHKETFDEKSKLNPKSPYALSKVSAEKYLGLNFSENSWILRFAPVYGDNFTLNIDRRTKIKNFFYRPGDGAKKMSLCNIFNINSVVEAIIKNEVPSGIYNISDRKYYTYNDLLKKVNAKSFIRIPNIFFHLSLLIGTFFKINFLAENSIKLLTNNFYPSKKIQYFVNLDHKLFD